MIKWVNLNTRKLYKLKKPYTQAIETQMQELHIRLSERNRRLYAGVEAQKLPYGGVKLYSTTIQLFPR